MTTLVAAGGGTDRSSHPLRGINRLFRRRRGLALGSLLSGPLAWMLVVYIGSLALLVASAMFRLDASSKPSDELTFDNIRKAFTVWDTVWIVLRTAATAAVVTVLCFVVAMPVTFFVAKIAPAWMRRGLVVALVLPLWAGYLVKGYAWRAMVTPAGGRFAAAGRGSGGFLESTIGWTPGYSRVAIFVVLAYMWLPYMVLPIYAGLERLPPSLLDAASDLGARPFHAFRTVVLPLLLPSIAAGAIFTFSLTLGDYIVPQIVNNGDERYMFGSQINAAFGTPNQPLAAAMTLWPVLIIVTFLLAMKRAGAFDNL